MAALDGEPVTPALLVLLLAASAGALPVCGPADGKFRVYQVETADLEAAKALLSKTFAFARSHRTSIACEVYARGEKLGPADKRYAETRWLPKQGRGKFEAELAKMGRVRTSEHAGTAVTAPPAGEAKRLAKKLAAEKDPARRKLLSAHLDSLESWEYTYRISGTMDLAQVRLLWREKDQPPFTPPPPARFKITPVVSEPETADGEELRRAEDWFRRN